jgi:pimeloyl-ACP methyl ester carboxylesterase
VAGRRAVVFLPGGVTPVAASYAPLLAIVSDEIAPVLKELEVYAAEEPPAGYSIAMEVDGLRRAVDGARLETFHLVGFSGGGAVSLAFAARYPERLRSLAMFEPANVPGAWDAYELDWWREFLEGMADLPPEQMLEEFTRRQIRAGAEMPAPPPGPTPEWMAKRPAGLKAMMAAFRSDDTDRDSLRRCAFPAYLAYGLMTADFMVHRVQLLAGLLPDLWIEAYPGIHHFGPPQRTQPAHYAASLRELWARADRTSLAPSPEGDSTYAA